MTKGEEKGMPKKIVVLLAAIVISSLGGVAMARGPQNIQNTPHNLSSGAPATQYYRAGNEDEICIFCHTPHGGDLRGQLWNRDMSAQSGKMYTHYDSATLSAAAKNSRPAGGTVSKESLLCLSCHDGSVGLGNIMNRSNRTGAPPDNSATTIAGAMFGHLGPNVGDTRDEWGNFQGLNDDLSDDHPISFSYSSVKDEYDTATPSRASELKTVAQAETNGVRFFGNDKRLECSSCHDPHVDYGDVWTSPNAGNPLHTKYKPFLIRDNIGSALCLSCHSK